jgi:hypothetical protein
LEDFLLLSKIIPFILLLTLMVSCAKTDEQLCQSAKDETKYLLTKNQCSKALSTIQGSCDNDDAQYIALVSSSQACSSGYSELDLFATDISSINSASLISSLASLSTSNETQADSDNYVALQTAIQTILTSTSGNPSASQRITTFGQEQGTNLNFQLLFMLVVQTGKYFNHYGDADATGTKGAGGSNTCIYSYTNADAVNWINTDPAGVGAGSCVAATGSEGSADLEAPVAAAEITTRLCEGIILFNNLMDVLGNVDLSDTVYGDLSNITTVINGLYTAAITAESANYGSSVVNTVRSIRSQSDCESLTQAQIEKYFAIFFESVYQ